jgi:transcriptional regulator with XRE-family HTH domain
MKIKIREIARNNKGFSLYRLAKELDLPQQTVYSWANGRTQPSYENLDKLCDVLECSIGDLLECEPVQHKLNLRSSGS